MGHKGQSQFWNVQKTPETVRFSSVVHGPSGTEPLLHCPEANKDRASSGLIMDRHVQSLFWEVQKPLLGNPEALRDRALLVGCTRAVGYRASWVWVIKSTLN